MMKKHIIFICSFFYSLLIFSQQDPDCCYTIPDPLRTFGAQLDPNIPIPINKTFLNTSYILNKPIVADLDGDGFNEILSFGASSAAILSGYGSDVLQVRSMTNPAVIKSIPLNSSKNNFSNVAVADLDNNLLNGLEIVAIDRNSIVHIFSNLTGINGTGPLAFNDLPLNNIPLPTQSVVPNIANLDNIGRPEIIIGNQIIYWDNGTNTWLKTQANNGTSGSRDFNTTFNNTNNSPSASDKFYELPLAIDVLPNPGTEIVMGPNIYSFSAGSLTLIYNMNNAIGSNNLNIKWLHDGFISAGNLDTDSNIEIAVNGSVVLEGPTANINDDIIATGIYIVDPINNSIDGFISSTLNTCLNNNGNYSFSGSAVSIADIDPAFPEAELIYLNTEQITVHNLSVGSTNNYQTWSSPLSVTDCSGQTGVTTFDFNSDGIKELVYRDETDLRIIYGGTDPSILTSADVDLERNWFKQNNVLSRTGVEYPTIVDLDNDGEAEIVTYGSAFTNSPNDVLGDLMVFESAPSTPAWGPTRSIWNQSQYFYSNINSDGTVPLNQVNQNTVISGQKPYNLFLGQPNLRANDTIWKPDVKIRVLESSCSTIRVEICNMCNEDVPIGMPITTYDNSPINSSSATVVNQQNTAVVIPKNGGCISMNIPTGSRSGTYFIVANDDASLTTPYNLSTDFPVTDIEECGYEDNMATANVRCPATPIPDCCENKLVIKEKNKGQVVNAQNGLFGSDPFSTVRYEYKITNPSVIPITEFRAVVTDLDFDYDLEACAECIDNPSLWGSIAGSYYVGDDLENTNPTTNLLDGRINRREVLWDSATGAMLNSGDTFSIDFLFPKLSEIPCCVTSVQMCLEFSYKDANCNICYEETCVTIELEEQPQQVESLKIDTTGKEECCSRNLSANTNGVNASYSWNTGETTKDITVTKNGTYTVTATSGGTSMTQTILINDIVTGNFPVLDHSSRFDPSGNTQNMHDKFYIFDSGKGLNAPNAYNVTKYKLWIFNRWGELIREFKGDSCEGFKNWSIQWDGKDNQGNLVQSGTYEWRFFVENCSNPKETQVRFRTGFEHCGCDKWFKIFGKKIFCISKRYCPKVEKVVAGHVNVLR